MKNSAAKIPNTLMAARIVLTALLTAVLTTACSGDKAADEKREQAREHYRNTNSIIPASEDIISFPAAPASGNVRALPNPDRNEDRNAYFGDLHVHTEFSFDASAFGTTATPADAYRYAQGEAIRHPSGFDVQLAQPLDFYAVTDHAIFLGLINEAADTTSPVSKYDFAEPYHNINESVDGGLLDLASRSKVFYGFISDVVAALLDGTIDNDFVTRITQSAWAETIEAANAAYKPGSFTTFAAYEYTSSGLHRNVVFRGTERLPAVPFSRFNSINPEGLWNWMDAMREQGVEGLAIPHNSNGSNGAMFMFTDWAGNAIDQEYAELRLRNEPLVEITQVKGTSDTHPALSPNDEWADFEIFPMQTSTKILSDPHGSYVRNAWQRGLAMEAGNGANPYKFGVVGASDTHTGAASLEEDNYFGKIGAFDSSAEKRGSIPASFLYGAMLKIGAPEMAEEVDGKTYIDFSGYKYWGASGIAGVWAEKNTREAIYDALRRKETFGTSGTRIKVRFFAGYGLEDADINSLDFIRNAYQSGTTMGGTLAVDDDKRPTFFTWAMADPNTAQLQRVQIIKGWLENGEHQEQVFDVACSDGLTVNPETHRCPDNGARVNLEDCSRTANVGAGELKTLWQDPDFTPGQEAFYYVRVLENPVCRWSTWDAIRAGEEPRSDLQATIQERAWSSPIWYSARQNSNLPDRELELH
jgi:Protein of unknown function (DUF3604)